ncbi:MAG: hypothetical protein ACRYG7_13160 [Janthinobacterium lividum]
MKNVMQAPSCSNSQAAQLSAHRRSIMAMLVGCPLITTAEYDTAMQRTLACQDVATLQRWYRNTVREIARREELEPVSAPITYATTAQVQEVQRLVNNVAITRAEKTEVLRTLPTLTSAAAVGVIGSLWAKLIARSAYPAPPADGWSKAGTVSYSSAA